LANFSNTYSVLQKYRKWTEREADSMAVRALPKAPETSAQDPLKDRKVRQFVQGGGSPAMTKVNEDGVKFTLPIPPKLLERLERHRADMPVPTKRIPWVLQAIAEKLEREGYWLGMATIPLRYENDTDPVSGGLIREADLLARHRDQIDNPRAERDRLLTQTERLTLALPGRAPRNLFGWFQRSAWRRYGYGAECPMAQSDLRLTGDVEPRNETARLRGGPQRPAEPGM
jgi:hypothetical protein